MTQQDSSLDFETSLEQLETLVAKMEKGQLSLDQSLEAFEEGVKLTRTCQETLKHAEQKVRQLTLNDTKVEEQPFDSTR